MDLDSILGGKYIVYPESREEFQRKNEASRTILCSDGTYVHSYGEKDIKEWLNEWRVSYIYDQHFDLNCGGDIRTPVPDFIMPTARVVIEYWGMAASWFPKKRLPYIERMLMKKTIYAAAGYTLIDVFHPHRCQDPEEVKARIARQLQTNGVPGRYGVYTVTSAPRPKPLPRLEKLAEALGLHQENMQTYLRKKGVKSFKDLTDDTSAEFAELKEALDRAYEEMEGKRPEPTGYERKQAIPAQPPQQPSLSERVVEPKTIAHTEAVPEEQAPIPEHLEAPAYKMDGEVVRRAREIRKELEETLRRIEDESGTPTAPGEGSVEKCILDGFEGIYDSVFLRKKGK